VRPPILAALAAAVALALAACGSSSSSAPGSSSASGAPAQTSAPAAATTTTSTAAQAGGACSAGAKTPPGKVAGAPLDTLLRVPAKARGHRAPLILALHFASGTGSQMEQATRYTPEARRAGFVVAYPTASQNNFWGIGNDLDKLSETLDAVERAACIDPSRVYVSGISNGGFMASVLMCGMANRVAAAVLFAPGIGGTGTCAPSRPVSLLEVHGTSDPIVPYGGPNGEVPRFVGGWARRDGCSTRSTAQRRSAVVTIFRWPGCRGGAQVEHLRLTGGKHIELLPQLRAAGVDPARTAWAFLRTHRLPAA
jgi:polyhydroxybutyrate depolymerase